MARFRKGKWYKVTFFDHVMGQSDPVKCVVVGYVVKQCKVSLTLSWWECLDIDLKEDNQELVTLLKSTFVQVDPLPRQFSEQ